MIDSRFEVGVVSNCWGAEEPALSLADLVLRAAEEGFEYVELRQGSLREGERPTSDGPPDPLGDVLAEVAGRTPQLGFNLAVELPFLSDIVGTDDPRFTTAVEAARRLGGRSVLRLVDVTPPAGLLEHEESIDALGEALSRLAERAWGTGRVTLAVENSRQPVSSVLAVIRRARCTTPAPIPPPRLCWDPHNQLIQQLRPEDPHLSAGDLSPHEFFEVHFKQQRDGALLSGVEEGDLDWRRIMQGLSRAGCCGPALFEIPAGERVWDRLRAGKTYLEQVADLEAE